MTWNHGFKHKAVLLQLSWHHNRGTAKIPEDRLLPRNALYVCAVYATIILSMTLLSPAKMVKVFWHGSYFQPTYTALHNWSPSNNRTKLLDFLLTGTMRTAQLLLHFPILHFHVAPRCILCGRDRLYRGYQISCKILSRSAKGFVSADAQLRTPNCLLGWCLEDSFTHLHSRKNGS